VSRAIKVNIHYADGHYAYSRSELSAPRCRCGGAHEVEVPTEIVELWDVVLAAEAKVQQQLATLDNDWYVQREAVEDRCRQREAVEDRCRRDGHARDMDGHCHYCGVEVEA
jgi:hypothetical protein